MFGLGPVPQGGVGLAGGPIGRNLYRNINTTCFPSGFPLFRLYLVVALCLFNLYNGDDVSVFYLRRLHVVCHLTLLVNFRIGLSGHVLFVGLPFTILSEIRLFFVLNLLSHLRVRLILTTIGPRYQPRLYANHVGSRLLRLQRFSLCTVAKGFFYCLKVATMGPYPISG